MSHSVTLYVVLDTLSNNTSVVRSSSNSDELLVSGIVIVSDVVSVELLNVPEIFIPEYKSIPLAETLVDSGTIEINRSDVNNTAQRMATNTRSRSRGFCQSRKPMSSSIFNASSNSGSSPSVISET